MSAPHVYRAIAAISRELAAKGIAKTQSNAEQGYLFRGIDDVYNALAPVLSKHKLCILPRVLARDAVERKSVSGEALFAVTIEAAFDFVSAADGSKHTVEVFAESLDGGDKGTNKAMSAAYKYAAFQTFCIPLVPDGDADRNNHKIRFFEASETPVQGWRQWTTDMIDVASSCETHDALSRHQLSHRKELQTLARAAPALYSEFGAAFLSRKHELSPPTAEQEGGSPLGLDLNAHTSGRQPEMEKIHAS